MGWTSLAFTARQTQWVLRERRGGGGGVAGTPPPPYSPRRRWAENFESSWHRRRRSKILAVSLKHWKGRRGGGEGGVYGGTPPHTPPPPHSLFCRGLRSTIQNRPKQAPKQSFGCQPQTLEGEEGGGGSACPTVYGRSNTSLPFPLTPGLPLVGSSPRPVWAAGDHPPRGPGRAGGRPGPR